MGDTLMPPPTPERSSLVKPGQRWQDIDPRMRGRTFLVVKIQQGKAVVLVDGTSRICRISLTRFRSNATGYRLVQDA